jgi:hypothetical protein
VSRKLGPNSDIAHALVQYWIYIQATGEVELTIASRHPAAYPAHPAAFLLIHSSASTRLQCARVHTNNTVATSVHQILLCDGDFRMTESNRMTEFGFST